MFKLFLFLVVIVVTVVTVYVMASLLAAVVAGFILVVGTLAYLIIGGKRLVESQTPAS
ncbi:MAG TPA: hypothetical protein VK694_06755 [Verrucomicrobiae bacterium]|nr:hypothetical protein [Verrucomicrobiae bacterium]